MAYIQTTRWALVGLGLLAGCDGGGSLPGGSTGGQAPPLSDSGLSQIDGAPGATGGGTSGSRTGGPAAGSVTATDAAGDATPAPPTSGDFPPVSDFAATGPYASTTMDAAGPDGNFTVYLPTELAPGGARNPIVGWMSGGGTTHSLYALLPHLASHGFVVVAANVSPGIGDEGNLGQLIIDGIDWAIAENGRSGSEFFGKLDTKNIASAGYSMGSLATFMIAADPRLTTTVHISGGNMAPERVSNLRAPAAFICGQTGGATCNILSPDCDIAAANCETDFDGATTPVFYATFAAGHLGILTQPFTDQINAMTTEWLRYQLMGDETRRESFGGADCTYCSDPDWKVQQKKLP